MEKFINASLLIHSVSHCKYIQELLAELGYTWKYSPEYTRDYTFEELILRADGSIAGNWKSRSPYKRIVIDNLLVMLDNKPPMTFKQGKCYDWGVGVYMLCNVGDKRWCLIGMPSIANREHNSSVVGNRWMDSVRLTYGSELSARQFELLSGSSIANEVDISGKRVYHASA